MVKIWNSVGKLQGKIEKIIQNVKQNQSEGMLRRTLIQWLHVGGSLFN